MTKMFSKTEMYLWILVMVVICLAFVQRAGIGLSNDSFQYLSVAENLRSHGQIATSIVFFDPERERGRLPAPETTFPAGYSLAIDSLLWTHVSPETAGWLSSLLSMICAVPLLWYGANLLGATAGLRRLAIAAWVLNSETIVYASAVGSEGLFTAIVLAAILLLMLIESGTSSTSRAYVPIAMALFGLSYWVRYAAVLVIAGLIVYTAWLAIHRNSRFLLWLSSLPICLGIVACGMIRNQLIAGTWRGGNNLVVHKSLIAMLRHHLEFGRPEAKVVLAISVLILAVLTAMVTTLLVYGKKTVRRISLPSPTSLLFIVVGVYCAGMTYLGTHTMISFGTRMFVPIFPEFILLVTAVLAYYWADISVARIYRSIPYMATAALLAYAGVNLYELSHYSEISPSVELASFYAERTPDGITLGEWFNRKLSPTLPVLAADGQATSYVLHRPTVSMAEKEFSARSWDESEVQKTMAAYSIRYLITYPGVTEKHAREQEETQFLRELINGTYPSWLIPVVRTQHVAIYEKRLPSEDNVEISRR